MTEPATIKEVEVLLLGGPMHQRVVNINPGEDYYHVGAKGRPWWTYENTFEFSQKGRKVFVLSPKSRKMKRLVLGAINATGKNPLVQRYMPSGM